MRIYSKTSLALLLLAFASVPMLFAQVGSCDLGTTSRDLDGNNVRARLYNNGGLFWRGSGNVYTVPINGTANSIFASGIWIGGRDTQGNVRFVGTAYGPWEMWPGPIDQSTGLPANPADCSSFDQIWKVTADDLENFQLNGTTTSDMETWPVDLGAPFVDADGDGTYNLASGDTPELIGEQTLWWVMNDAGNQKGWSETAPIGLEAQVTAFAFNTADALNNTTFYKYKLIHKGSEPMTDVYFGIWSDPDLGDASDDYVGSDSTLGLGYVYNGDDVDAGVDGYGTRPPALAYDFFQGPLVPAPGEVFIDPDGTVHNDSTRLNMTRFVYYNNDSSPIGNPTGNTDEPYNYMQGIWRDGTPMTLGGTGYNPGSTNLTQYIFPGDPVSGSFWSEENTDGVGSRNTPADRRFVMATGPFDLNPGDIQEIVYGVVWSQAPTDNNARLASVAKMRFDDILAQGAFNSNFDIPPPPNAPEVAVTSQDKTVIIEWANKPTDNNYLNAYDEPSAFLVDTNPPDGNTTYTFEGYRIIQYASATDQEGTVVATYDVPNNVRVVVDQDIDLNTGALITGVVANGGDVGVQNFHIIENLTNYQTYYFGVQAYAYNPNSLPKIYASPVERFSIIPTPEANRDGGTLANADRLDVLVADRLQGTGDPSGVIATVSNPLAITGDNYSINIIDLVDVRGQMVDTDGDGTPDTNTLLGPDGNPIVDGNGDPITSALTYTLSNATTGETIVSGIDWYDSRKAVLAFGDNLITVDGLSFGINGPPDDFDLIEAVANGAGPIPEGSRGAVSSWQSFPGAAPTSSVQQSNGQRPYIFHTADNGSRAAYTAFVNRVTNGGEIGNFGGRIIVPYDFEMRFTATGSQAYDPFITACYFDVPFELWRIGIGTPDDPSDDIQMVPYVLDDDATSLFGFDGMAPYNLFTQKAHDAFNAAVGRPPFATADHSGSSLSNDPQTDWVYWTTPDDETPGTAGFDAWKTYMDNTLGGVGNCDDGSQYNEQTTDNSLRRTTVFQWNGGDVCNDTDGDGACEVPTYAGNMPETGTVIRISTKKPLSAGDEFSFGTAALAATTDSLGLAETELDNIGIVPNPYKGASAYEVDVARDEARFTNLPQRATIRVYTLAGTLVRTLEKNSSAATLSWNLQTEEGLPLASGMYLIHVEVPGVGDKVIKFGFVKKRIQLDLF